MKPDKHYPVRPKRTRRGTMCTCTHREHGHTVRTDSPAGGCRYCMCPEYDWNGGTVEIEDEWDD